MTETIFSQKSTSSVESSLSQINKSLVYEPSYRQDRNLNSDFISIQNRIEFKETVLTSQRYNISNRATAALGTSTLIDLGVIIKTDTTIVTDKNKIMRGK